MIPQLIAGLPLAAWLVVAAAALLVGISKTSIGGLGMVAVGLVAVVMPTKDSTGVVLLMLLTGDLVAIWIYRRTVDWRLIGRLMLPVAAGIAIGAVFLTRVDDLVLRRTIGILLLGLLVVGLWRDRLPAHGRAMALGYGGLAGFTTMVANAGGAPMNLYLLAAKYDKWRFLGTGAWFFFTVNAIKLPISVGLGIVRVDTVALWATVVPVVLLGTWLGRVVIKRVDQRLFETLVTISVAASALYLTFV
ncbi:MAG: sulfite exporter TauE/SafE family protein [Propionicimonas sp.]|nr:sulfite exporter TauE/SafE family protein [Propionicimonas sp.]